MTLTRLPVALVVAVALGSGCGGGGSTASGPGAPTGPTGPLSIQGIALPKEVSALPTGSAGAPGLRAGLMGAAVPLAGSDYDAAKTAKYVSERSLDQFNILTVIFNALAQTHYDDVSVVNRGPYAAMVTWEDKGDQGQDQKMLVRWVVDSTRASETAPNVVKAWFLQSMKGPTPFTIQANIEVTTAPTLAPDGSYLDYGVWRMDVKVAENVPFRFVASAEKDAQGRATIRMSQAEPVPGGGAVTTRGILVRSAQAGSGRVEYPDWDSCQTQDCVPATSSTVTYAYDPAIVTLSRNQGEKVTKSRNVFVDVVNRYGLYDAVTGEDVTHVRRFGFPVRATVDGSEVFGYYGAWQGRHQLWANGQPVSAGQVVTRADVPPGQTAPRYTATAPLAGILVKRTLAAAQASDLTGLVVETWDNQNFMLGFDGQGWCKDPMKSPGGAPGQIVLTCNPGSGFADWASLELDPLDVKRSVWINGFDPIQNQPLCLVYASAAPGGPGLYPARCDAGPQPVRSSDVPWRPQVGDMVGVNVGGSIFITYDGIDWHRKSVMGFDTQTWTPTFGPGPDPSYALQPGREYYFNSSGTNYIAKTDGTTLDVLLEIQSVANPGNAATFLPPGTELSETWCGSGTCSTYQFVTSAADPAKFMKLVYKTLSEADEKAGKQVGAVVTTGRFGLVAVIEGAPVQFNWDYPQEGQNSGGVQQFLVDANGVYILLDDPIRLEQVTLSNGLVAPRTFTVQFDGNWMQGLPNLWDDLRASGFQATQAIAEKNFSIPNGTILGGYIVKQLQVSEYMAASLAQPLDLTTAGRIDLGTIPAFVDHLLGPMPAADLKYSEGKPVTAR